jgi:AcrR family transcriptional regulator
MTQEDRRVRRSRQAIREAFVSLVLEHGFDAVSVEDIVLGAEVARATFYAHFRDKNDLLTAIVGDLAEDLSEQFAPLVTTGPVFQGTVVRVLFRHADLHRPLYRVMLSGASEGRARAAYSRVIATAIERVFTEVVRVHGGVPRVAPAVVAQAWSGSHLALLEWWLEETPERTGDEVALDAMRLLINGPVWALGVEGKGIALDESRFTARPDPTAAG